jgi:hypothetical protein
MRSPLRIQSDTVGTFIAGDSDVGRASHQARRQIFSRGLGGISLQKVPGRAGRLVSRSQRYRLQNERGEQYRQAQKASRRLAG